MAAACHLGHRLGPVFQGEQSGLFKCNMLFTRIDKLRVRDYLFQLTV